MASLLIFNGVSQQTPAEIPDKQNVRGPSAVFQVPWGAVESSPGMVRPFIVLAVLTLGLCFSRGLVVHMVSPCMLLRVYSMLILKPIALI